MSDVNARIGEIVNGHDVVVLQTGGDPCLAQKPGARLGAMASTAGEQ